MVDEADLLQTTLMDIESGCLNVLTLLLMVRSGEVEDDEMSEHISRIFDELDSISESTETIRVFGPDGIEQTP